ncbi:pyrroline-5-carboxylate reductase [Neorhizobium sp. NPDC001467]|uniref:pyrroline-5-carboxylate reductase n=1 Tax=Neorhizobium sp. NPDC001467 TaxID=3390595 RepID=UPI003D02D5AA
MTEGAALPVVLVGAGNMGGAMLSGWLDGDRDGSSIVVIDPSPSAAITAKLAEKGASSYPSAPEGMVAGILFLAVKPQMMETVLPAIARLVGPQTAVVSVAAGTTLAVLSRHLGDVAMVRAMPNTPAMIGRGITGAYANAAVTEAQRRQVNDLLAVSGPVEWLASEADIDAVTAVSGSGPAYVFHLVECMAEAGRKLGLPADLAMRLARETVSGAGELMRRSSDDAAQLRKNVTSPGGTTAAALAVLMADNGLQPLFDAALEAARTRAQELGQRS